MGVFGDLKGSVIRNFLQHGDVFETKPEDDFIYNCNRYELLHDSWDIKCPISVLYGSNYLSLGHPCLNWQEAHRGHLVLSPFSRLSKAVRGDGVGKGCVLSWGKVQVSVVVFPLARCPHHLSGVLTSLKQDSDQLVQVLP